MENPIFATFKKLGSADHILIRINDITKVEALVEGGAAIYHGAVHSEVDHDVYEISDIIRKSIDIYSALRRG